MLALIAEAALRSLLLGGVVWIGLSLFRAGNPYVQKSCWIVVLAASLSMPLMMQWATVTITRQAPPVVLHEPIAPAQTTLTEAEQMVLPEPGGPAPSGEIGKAPLDPWTLATSV